MSKADIRTCAKEIIDIMVSNDKAVIRSDELIRRIKSHIDLSDIPEDEKDGALIKQVLYPLLN